MSNRKDDTKISAVEIMALDDEQLDQYLKDNMRFVDVKDPENLNEVFIQRLRARTLNPKSVAVDPLKLTARLLGAPTYRERPERSPSFESTSTISFGEGGEHQYNRRLEAEAYHRLVDKGGRPSHPLERMDDIVSDPGEYRDILTFWQTNDQDWEVFSRQSGEWVDFQRAQRLVRQGPFMDDSHLFLAVHNESYDDFAKEFPKLANGKRDFPEYAQSARERLARNGFARPFELNRDIAKQDKMTTWIEFLNWEYMWYERFVSSKEIGKRRRDEAWKTLVGSGVLKSGETEEELCTLEHRLECSVEENTTEHAVETAKVDLASAEQTLTVVHKSSVPLPELRRRVNTAQARLAIAENTHKKVAQRNENITQFSIKTRNYRMAKKDAERRLILLRWMLQQIPLIEKEEGSSGAVQLGEEVKSDTVLSELAAGGANVERTPSSSSHKYPTSALESEQATSPSSRSFKRARDEDYGEKKPSKQAKRSHDTMQAKDDATTLVREQQQGSLPAIKSVSRPQCCGKRRTRIHENASAEDARHQQASHQVHPRSSERIAQQQQKRLNSKVTHAPSTRSRNRRPDRVQLPSPPDSQSGKSGKDGSCTRVTKRKSRKQAR